ncbi:MAG: hypothetical protein ACRDZO_11065, partial [Egibacteraceae bacterium]
GKLGGMIPDWLTLVFWVRLPVAVARLSPAAASVLMDGVYLVRGTFLGAGAPVLTALLGLLGGALHSGQTFATSLLVMGFLGVAAMMSAHLGLLGTIGYVIGDLVIRERAQSGLQESVALLFSYALLALLTVYLPLLVGTVRLAARTAYKRGDLPLWLEIVAAVVVAATGAFAWAQALRVLIRPAFAWQGAQVSASDLGPLTGGWSILVAVTAGAAALRVWREHKGRGGVVAAHVKEVRSALRPRTRRVTSARPVQQPLAIGATAALLTVLVAGLIDGIAQGVVVFMFFAAMLWGRARLAGTPAPGSGPRVSVLARGAVAVVAGYGLSALLLTVPNGSWPALAGTCLTAALVVLATARSSARPRGAKTGA